MAVNIEYDSRCLRNEEHLLRTDTEIYYVRGGYS